MGRLEGQCLDASRKTWCSPTPCALITAAHIFNFQQEQAQQQARCVSCPASPGSSLSCLKPLELSLRLCQGKRSWLSYSWQIPAKGVAIVPKPSGTVPGWEAGLGVAAEYPRFWGYGCKEGPLQLSNPRPYSAHFPSLSPPSGFWEIPRGWT